MHRKMRRYIQLRKVCISPVNVLMGISGPRARPLAMPARMPPRMPNAKPPSTTGI